jgi:hypothetical protein
MRNAAHRPAILHLLSSILALVLPLPASAQTAVDLMLKPFAENTPIDINSTAYVLSSGHTDSDRSYQLSIVDVSGRYRFAPTERYDPRLGFNATYLNLDSKDPILPNGLLDTSVAVGLGIYEDKPSGWQAGLTLGFGYAGASGGSGDNLFSDANAWYGQASLLVGKKFNKTDGLVFVLDYDGNRTYKPDVPIPGVAYQKLIFGNPDPARQGGKFEPTLLLTLGVPYTSVHWQPLDHLTVDAWFLLPEDFSLRVDYDLLGGKRLGVFGALETRREAFHWNRLTSGTSRLLYYQRRAELGLRWTPAHKVNLLVAAGYAFGQELTTGFDSSNDDKLTDLSDEPYLRVGLEVGF